MSAEAPAQDAPQQESRPRKDSFSGKSQTSETSQTAAEFIRSQEALEADAREALPYSIDTCTKILGPLRQAVFACLTCNPPPAKDGDDWTPAGVCYACSIQCHGEHNLVEIFQKRNFTCDCGTKRIPSTSPCTLRLNEATNTRGGVHSEEPDVNNKYNHNFRNRFCGCDCDYDPFQQKGTMFQCLGLGTVETGGCGEDWYHPGCLVGMGPNWFEKMEKPKKTAPENNEEGKLTTIAEGNEEKQDPAQTAGQDKEKAAENAVEADEGEDEDVPMPPDSPKKMHSKLSCATSVSRRTRGSSAMLVLQASFQPYSSTNRIPSQRRSPSPRRRSLSLQLRLQLQLRLAKIHESARLMTT
ncbi:hypothetical protein NXS19_003279 [Fusarium pseudograminearum]|nr:hypothetical protein NXS19_003279 [Fusarium pseudograminearum]